MPEYIVQENPAALQQRSDDNIIQGKNNTVHQPDGDQTPS